MGFRVELSRSPSSPACGILRATANLLGAEARCILGEIFPSIGEGARLAIQSASKDALPEKGDASWLRLAVVWLLIFLGAAWLQWRLRDMMFDDAFIHLRVARNLALHGAADFNPGEPVMTTSSPLWTLLLAALGISTHIWLLPFFEAALLTSCGALAYLLSRRLLPGAPQSRALSILLAGVAAALSMLLLLPSSVGQMETPLAMALLLGALWCLADEVSSGRRLALPLLALAACTRLEILPLLLAACVLCAIVETNFRSLLAAVGIVLAMATAVYAQFGVLLPNSMRAKSIGYAYSRADVVQQIFEARFLEVPLALCLAVFLASMAADRWLAPRQGRSARPAWIPFFAGIWGMCAMLEYVVRRTPIFEWYRPIFWLPWLLCLLLYRNAATSYPWLRFPTELARSAGIVLLLLVPVWKGSMLVAAAVEETPISRSTVDRGDSARVREYLAVGRALRATCPGGNLMTAEIGALGWAFNGYIYDAFGIASPRALAFQPLRSGAPVAGIPVGYAAEVRPDIIVSYTPLDVEVRDDPALMAQYDLVELPTTLPIDGSSSAQAGWHGSAHLDVMLRKDGSCRVATAERSLRAAVQ